MPDIKVLRTSVQALFPADSRPQFTHVASAVTPPWTRVLISIPNISSRALNGRALTRRCTIRTLIVAANEQAAWAVADLALGLEGRTPTADGWQCSPVRALSADPRPYEDTDATSTQTSKPLVCIPIDFDFFATERQLP